MQLSQRENPINTVDKWFEHAKPRGGMFQWRDGYSAKELAKAWCSSGTACVPTDFAELLHRVPGFSPIMPVSGHPEQRVRFDGLPGEPRNADLVLRCESPNGTVAVSVEAKAQESFGDYVHVVIEKAAQNLAEEIPSNQLERLQTLYRALLPHRSPGAPAFGELRYQLLTAAAGALVFAHQIHAVAAVLVIHEFRPPHAHGRRFADNARDLNSFVHRLTGQAPAAEESVFGPINVRGGDTIPAHLPFFVAKLTSPCDAPEPLVPRRRPEA